MPVPQVLHTHRSLHFTAGEDAASSNTCLLMVLNKFLMMQPVHMTRNLGCSDSLRMLYQLCLTFVSINYNSVAHRHVSLDNVLASMISVTFHHLDRYIRHVQEKPDSSKPLQ